MGRNRSAEPPGTIARYETFLSHRFALSPRELAVLRGICLDRSKSEIAFALGVSPHTVQTYCTRLFRKLGTSSRLGAVIRSFEAIIDEGVCPSTDGHSIRDC